MNGAGVTSITVDAINDAATAVGTAQKWSGLTSLGSRPVRWTSNGTAVELGTLGVDRNGVADGEALAINSSGMAVGYSGIYSNGSIQGTTAVRWSASSTTPTALGNIWPGNSGPFSEAYAVNSSGVSVGYGQKYVQGGPSKGPRPVRWDAAGNPTELGNLGTDPTGYSDGEAFAVNDAGTAVGYTGQYDNSGTLVGLYAAVRWEASDPAAVSLGGIGGATSGEAYAINNLGTAVGWAPKGNLGQRAVRWDASGTAATELGVLGTNSSGNTSATAVAINNANVIVGYATSYNRFGVSNGDRAVYWGPDGVAVDLNTLIDPASNWSLTQAYSISDTGWIMGHGLYFDPSIGSYDRLFSINVPAIAVPEPSTLVLGTCGFLVAILLRTRLAGANGSAVWVSEISLEHLRTS